MIDDKLVDVCIEWIQEKQAAYLCKENEIVYYTSFTTRKGDSDWVHLTIPATIRIIEVHKTSNSGLITQNHIVQACQELERVYEFGTNKSSKTSPSVFNFTREEKFDLADPIIKEVSEMLFIGGFYCLFYAEVNKLIRDVLDRIGQYCSMSNRMSLISKHFTNLNYTIRDGVNRLSVVEDYRGIAKLRLKKVIILKGNKPSSIVSIKGGVTEHMVDKLIKEFE